MSSQQPQLPSSTLSGVQVVTLTVFSNGTSIPSPHPSGGSPPVPVGAIVGGAAGGMALAVILVLIWKYWGRAIKRTERKRRKEVLDMLTVRENTRRNATTTNKPQTHFRPILKLNPEGRRVTFLNRSPTSPRSKRDKKNATPLALTSTDPAEYEQKGNNQEVPAAGPSTDLTRQSLQTQILTLAPAPQQMNERPELEQNEGGGERWPIEDTRVIPTRDTSSPTPSRNTSRRVPSPTPSGSSPRRVPSPTPFQPFHDTPKRTSQLTPSRSTRTPRTLPDPPTLRPVPPRLADMHSYVPPPSGPTIFASPPVSPATSSSHAHEMLATSSISSHAPLVSSPLVAVAGPSSSSSSSSFSPASSQPTLTMTSSPLRHSVLPSSSRPVIMPRAKHTSTLPSPTDSQPSPLSASSSKGGQVPPSLAGSASQYSAESGERPVRRSYLESLRPFRASAAGTAGAEALRLSTQSSASAYSND